MKIVHRHSRRWRQIAFFLALLLFLRASVTAATRPWSCGCEPERVLSLASPRQHGSDILGLQKYLLKLGFHPGSSDGIYGPRTAAAVTAFQRQQNLKGDGIVNATTRAALGSGDLESLYTGPRSLSHHGRIELVLDIRLTILIIYDHGKVLAIYPVAMGKDGKPTPVGNFRVIEKAIWGGGFGSRWMGLDVPWGVYGIHGTNRPWTIGGYESAGCVRMFNSDIEQLYDLVSPGTPVHIIGDPFYNTTGLGPGDMGAPVAFLQRRLKQLGFYRNGIDGYYLNKTEKAVMKFQESRKLEQTGRIGEAEIQAMRIRQGD